MSAPAAPSPFPPAPPTIRFHETLDGGAFTLGAPLTTRLFHLCFLGVALAVWVLVLGALLERSLESVEQLRQGLRHAWRPLGYSTVGVVVWGLGGLFLAWSFLRHFFSRESVILEPRRWRIRRTILGVGKTRDVETSRVEEITLVRGHLWVHTDTGTIPVAATGTRQDRRWLRKVLSTLLDDHRRGRGGPGPVRLLESADEGVSRRFVVHELFDRFVLDATPARRAWHSLPCLLLWTIWNGALGWFIASRLAHDSALEVDHPHAALAPGSWSWWLLLSPFLLVSAALTALLIATALDRTHYHVRAGRLEIERFAPGGRTRRTFSGAELVVTRSTRPSGRPCVLHALQVVDPRGRREVLLRDRSSRPVLALAHWLSQRTGFPLRRESASPRGAGSPTGGAPPR